MFEKGDYVIYGSNGICRVQDVTTLDIPGVDKNRKYYLLKPVYTSASTVYTPVDTEGTLLRPVKRGSRQPDPVHPRDPADPTGQRKDPGKDL